jgi:hypothetical protein
MRCAEVTGQLHEGGNAELSEQVSHGVRLPTPGSPGQEKPALEALPGGQQALPAASQSDDLALDGVQHMGKTNPSVGVLPRTLVEPQPCRGVLADLTTELTAAVRGKRCAAERPERRQPPQKSRSAPRSSSAVRRRPSFNQYRPHSTPGLTAAGGPLARFGQ